MEDALLAKVTMLETERDQLREKLAELEESLDEVEKDREDLVQRVYDLTRDDAGEDRDLLLRVVGISKREFDLKRSKLELSPRLALEEILRERARS